MSRATRPHRRLRGPERDERVLERVRVIVLCDRELYAAAHLASETERCLRTLARALSCRPSHLRRALLGRVLPARAAQRILTAAGWR